MTQGTGRRAGLLFFSMSSSMQVQRDWRVTPQPGRSGLESLPTVVEKLPQDVIEHVCYSISLLVQSGARSTLHPF